MSQLLSSQSPTLPHTSCSKGHQGVGHRPRRRWLSPRIIPHSHQRQYLFIISLLSLLLLISFPQSVSAQSPPIPQPGSGLDGTSSPGVSPTKTQDSQSSGLTPTVTMVNGAATSISYPPQQPVAPPSVPMTTTLPKAPQSILVVESTAYGKVLPAAGPTDDQIGGHFWDQFGQIPNGDSKSLAALVSLPQSCFIANSFFFGLIAAVALLNI